MRPRNWRGVSITRWPGCSRSETPVGGGVVPPCRGIGPATLRSAAVASRNAPCSATLRSSTPYLPTCVTTCRPCAATGNGSCQRPTLTSGPPPRPPARGRDHWAATFDPPHSGRMGRSGSDRTPASGTRTGRPDRQPRRWTVPVHVPNGTATAPTRIRACSWSSRAFTSFQIRVPCRSNWNCTIKGAPRFWARLDSTAQSGCDVARGEKCSCTSFHSSPALTNTMVACCLSSVGEPFIMPVK